MINWPSMRNEYKHKVPAYNEFSWQICKNQLITIGLPLDAVAFVMSVPEECKTSLDVLRVSLLHFPEF